MLNTRRMSAGMDKLVLVLILMLIECLIRRITKCCCFLWEPWFIVNTCIKDCELLKYLGIYILNNIKHLLKGLEHFISV